MEEEQKYDLEDVEEEKYEGDFMMKFVNLHEGSVFGICQPNS